MKKRIGPLVAVFAAALLFSVVLVSAQQPQQPPPAQPQPPPPQQQPPPPPPRDPMGDVIFPPELVMQHQRELGLTDEQKTFMRGEINRTTTRFNELQWQLQDAMEALHETMKANSVNEQLALSQLDKILDSEREVKRAHMELAIRIKNKLTPEQQAKLQSMKRDRGPGLDGPGGPGGPGRGPGHGPGGPGGPGPGGPGQRPPDAPLDF
jgi:Spy/CpxP family protein refolding chaperone